MKSPATAELLAIESEADKELSSLPIPHPSRDISAWHILTVFEDSLRFRFVGHVESDLIDTGIWGDLSKYSLRHCLDQIFARCDSNYGMTPPKKTIPQAYKRAFEFYAKGIDYSSISRIFTSLHTGHSSAIKVDDAYEITYSNFIDARYGALEALSHGQESPFDITAQIHVWFRNIGELPVALNIIEQFTTIKGKFVHYEYGPQAFALQEEMNQRPSIIPEKWQFPWGSALDTHALINSLLIRCAYHFLSVNLAANRSGFSGGAESSLVLATKKADLCRDISMFADIGDKKIESFVDHMTYGYRTRTPDPALQPLIPTINGDILIPCLHTITCNLQRNILSLMARLNAPSFDTQSRLFEIDMIESLEKLLDKFPLKCTNKKIKLKGREQEFDILIADTSTKTVMILELRWILQPGDPREVSNKIKECSKKTKKLEEKIAFLKQNTRSAFELFFPQAQNQESFEDWTICGIVVIEGFGGTLSENSDCPITTSDVLKIGLSSISDIRKLMEWIKSLTWLPQQGTHFENGREEVKIGTHRILRPGIHLMDEAVRYRDHIHESLTRYN
ncbi:hypothetical protein [Burkholderia pseudomultivorans]|uniref:Uncharacterized protein n=1 Tax=Burkholderia pseudomultivorans TaxID=1207504 RepID=A0ABU2EE77_9BURK|nr:hypothetical protein [Burkholderia pseudomultivorans]MDR8729628.1 hypothetical protein [Burkholderia pseudomultivorans]MDR8738062.1 hypothetical protein [Burkholderia pseudomultivorans]MDR8745801.1 hypothetical protein [Burkholderia pseudomultivorans]MDR8758203.1 hypothetical protein [Burkholderia pseudomultivorans]MDR8780780.1 hypothetical protein [Burkholderia pseudomultivorans]